MENKENIFEISYEQIQNFAVERIGRILSVEELYDVKKGIEAGLTFDIETVFSAAIQFAVENNVNL